MLKNDYFVRTFIEFPADTKSSSNDFDTQCSVKNLMNLSGPEINKTINMSNYSVPFDFDGKNYTIIDSHKRYT